MMADWDSSAFSAYENLEMATSFDLGMAFQENIPDMFHESSVVPDVPSEFYPPVQETYDLMSATCTSGIKPELCDISNAHFVQQQQHTEYIPDWEAFQVPSTTTSPVQFESWQHAGATVNTVPARYQQQQQLYNTNVVNGRKRRAVPQPCEASQMDFNVGQFPGMSEPVTKPKRKRVQNTRQRKAANVRERKRMFHLNEAFDSLKTRVPTFSYEKRLSRIETLKLAMTYISFMSQLLDGKKPNEIPLNSGSTTSFSLEDLENLQRSIGSSYVSDGTESSESGSTSS